MVTVVLVYSVAVGLYFSSQPTGYAVADVPDAALGSTAAGIMWFAQLTDLHISRFRSQRAVDLEAMVTNLLPKTVGPCFVLVSGDLTDSKLGTVFISICRVRWLMGDV